MKINSIGILLLITFGNAVSGQAQTGGAVYFHTNVQSFSFPKLEGSLTQAGYEGIPLTFGFGSGGYGQFKNWRAGGEGTYFTGSRENEIATTEAEGGWGYFYCGYVAGKKWKVVPAMGVGWGGVTINAVQLSSGTLSDLLTIAPNTSRIYSGDAFLHTSLAVERTLPGNFYLSLKADYHLGFSGNQDWKANGLTDSVADSFRAFQASFIFGFMLNN